jgi:glycosyltransferase involved in cell wall biosynthesis
MEIVVVDGMSTDRTRKIVTEYCKNYPFIRMIDNQLKIKPKALNIGITSTDSDVVMRIDAHAVYAKNYISKLVEGLFQHHADNIGGVRKTFSGKSAIENAISFAISHPFSVGNAYWRTGTRVLREVDTVFCGCYRRDVFKRIGYFNEKLIRTQDKEFNARLIRSGGKIICDPSVVCTYFPRSNIIEYLKWNFSGAFWQFYAWRFTKVKMTSWRNFVPMIFLFYSILLFFLFRSSIANSAVKIVVATPLLIYVALALYYSIQMALKKGKLVYAPLLFFILPATHYSYGIASICGLIKARILGKDCVV